MKKSFLVFTLLLISFLGFSQTEKNVPLFSSSDSLGMYGEWQTLKYKGDKGEEIVISIRFKVRKKFMMTCLFAAEVRNDGEKNVKVTFMAGNKGTNYYDGQIGVVREKVKLSPKAIVGVEYRLPIPNNSKEDTDAMVCKKCKELDHFFKFAK